MVQIMRLSVSCCTSVRCNSSIALPHCNVKWMATRLSMKSPSQGNISNRAAIHFTKQWGLRCYYDNTTIGVPVYFQFRYLSVGTMNFFIFKTRCLYRQVTFSQELLYFYVLIWKTLSRFFVTIQRATLAPCHNKCFIFLHKLSNAMSHHLGMWTVWKFCNQNKVFAFLHACLYLFVIHMASLTIS